MEAKTIEESNHNIKILTATILRKEDLIEFKNKVKLKTIYYTLVEDQEFKSIEITKKDVDETIKIMEEMKRKQILKQEKNKKNKIMLEL